MQIRVPITEKIGELSRKRAERFIQHDFKSKSRPELKPYHELRPLSPQLTGKH
jgi:hypothetical protein